MDKIITLLDFATLNSKYQQDDLLDAYCPNIINQLKDFFPYKKHHKYKDDCKYRYEDDEAMCLKCWERKLII